MAVAAAARTNGSESAMAARISWAVDGVGVPIAGYARTACARTPPSSSATLRSRATRAVAASAPSLPSASAEFARTCGLTWASREPAPVPLRPHAHFAQRSAASGSPNCPGRACARTRLAHGDFCRSLSDLPQSFDRLGPNERRYRP